MYDVLIAGGGPAGLTAAIYARRAGLSVLVLESSVCGGQIVNSPQVDNYPALPNVPGWQFATQLQSQAEALGAKIASAAVERAEKDQDGFTIYTSAGVEQCRAFIIANGAAPRRLDCPGAEQYFGHGVSSCATCDGAFYKGRDTVVVGGGNTAFEDAAYLAALCSSVTLINRRAQFRADSQAVEELRGFANAAILTPYVPLEVLGDGQRVTALKIMNTETQEERTLNVSGVFAAIGVAPDNSRFSNLVELDPSGYIVSGEDCLTSTPGVFAAGDTRTKKLRQLVTAASDGAMAANQAAAYIRSGR